MRTAFWLAGATVLALANPAVAADTIKIGLSLPSAARPR